MLTGVYVYCDLIPSCFFPQSGEYEQNYAHSPDQVKASGSK